MKKSLVFATSIFTMSLLLTGCNNDDKEKFELSNTIDKTYLLNMHISEYSDRNAGVQPDTFAMRFSRV